jgi:transposase
MASGEEEGLFDFLPEQAVPERVGGGLPRLRFAERMQTRWRPASLDGLLPDDHRVRLVWSFVEGLDVTALLATIKAVDGRPGHPPADPRILLALWLYATVEGIGSAREVARLCDEHIAFEWLCGGVGMNAKTLADFRVDHGAVLEGLLVDSFTALVRAGVGRASAGAASFRRHSTLQECRCEAEKAVHDLRTQLDTDPGADSDLRCLVQIWTVKGDSRHWPPPNSFPGFLAQALKESILDHHMAATLALTIGLLLPAQCTCTPSYRTQSWL